MPRAVWTGTLSFGLVSIPVALIPATQPKDVRFHLFDRHGRRVRYRRFAEGSASASTDAADPSSPRPSDSGETTPEGEIGSPGDPSRDDDVAVSSAGELRYEQLVRGYEVEPGRFAMLEPEEIERVRPSRSSTIDLEDFVELDAIDPVYFEKSYYLAPRREATKPYRLLREALDRSRRVGIGRFVLRTKPHLVAVRATGEVLGLETLFFGDEVRSAAEIAPATDDGLSDREVRLAQQLVEMLAAPWVPERYADEYRQELFRIIEEKTTVETGGPQDPSSLSPASGVEELMDALRRSVEQAKDRQGKPRRRTG